MKNFNSEGKKEKGRRNRKIKGTVLKENKRKRIKKEESWEEENI
jgi:hypothetical protein